MIKSLVYCGVHRESGRRWISPASDSANRCESALVDVKCVCVCVDLYPVTAEGRDLCLVTGTTNRLAPSPDPEGTCSPLTHVFIIKHTDATRHVSVT